MATDFGDELFDLGLEFVRSKFIGPEVAAPGPSIIPPLIRTVSDVTRAVVARKKKRRRRRRLLTPTDLADLAALKTITGNNDALKFAVLKAVRR